MNRVAEPLRGDEIPRMPVTFRGADGERAVFLFHDGAGVDSAALGEHLRDTTVHAFCHAAMCGPEFRTIEGAATALVRTLRSIQPVGPYRILSSPQHFLIAYEVATQLIGADELVDLLGVVPATAQHGARSTAACCAARRYRDETYDLYPLPIAIDVALSDDELRSVPATIAQAVRGIRGDAAAPSAYEYEPLVPLQHGDPGQRPVFCVPGAGDVPTQFIDVAAELGSATPVYAFQHRGLDGAAVPHASVEVIARVYRKAIAQTHPGERVHLVGHSFGGWVAFEIARQLELDGHAVASLTIIDSEAADAAGDPIREYSRGDVLREWVDAIELSTSKPLGIPPAALEARDQAGRLQHVHERMIAVQAMPKRSRWEILEGPLRTFAAALRTNYSAGVHAGRVALLLAEDTRLTAEANRRREADIVAGWRRFAPNLVHRQGPGNHVTILKPPHARWLARWWRSSVECSADAAVAGTVGH